MTALLAFVTVAAFGTWIPLAQMLPGVPQRSRTLSRYCRQPYLRRDRSAGGRRPPGAWLAELLVAAGRRCGTARRQLLRLQGLGDDRDRPRRRNLDAAQHHRRVRLGALLFGELDHLSGTRFVLITVALAAILAGILLIVSSQDSSGARGVPADPPSPQAIEKEPRGWPEGAAACCGQPLRGLRGEVTSCPRSGPQNRHR